jgi:hypothetical protein
VGVVPTHSHRTLILLYIQNIMKSKEIIRVNKAIAIIIRMYMKDKKNNDGKEEEEEEREALYILGWGDKKIKEKEEINEKEIRIKKLVVKILGYKKKLNSLIDLLNETKQELKNDVINTEKKIEKEKEEKERKKREEEERKKE